MGYGPRQKQVRLYRGQIPSPGRPTVAWREDRVRFWGAIARGVKTEDAAVEAGVSSPVAFRWFRKAGGMNPRLCDGTAETTLGDYVGPPPVFVGDEGSRFLDRVQVAMGAWALEQLSAEATGQ